MVPLDGRYLLAGVYGWELKLIAGITHNITAGAL